MWVSIFHKQIHPPSYLYSRALVSMVPGAVLFGYIELKGVSSKLCELFYHSAEPFRLPTSSHHLKSCNFPLTQCFFAGLPPFIECILLPAHPVYGQWGWRFCAQTALRLYGMSWHEKFSIQIETPCLPLFSCVFATCLRHRFLCLLLSHLKAQIPSRWEEANMPWIATKGSPPW